MKVLVIDNDKTSAEALSHTLAEQGQIVHIATDGVRVFASQKRFPTT